MHHLKGIAGITRHRRGIFRISTISHVLHDLELTKKLAEAGVIVVPGSAFGQFGEGHVRISYAASHENIDRAFQIIKELVA